MKKNKDKPKDLKKPLLYNSIGNFIYLLCQWLITIVVVRISGYKEAGILSLCMSISNTIYAISAFSMRGYQSSDINSDFTHSEYFNSRILTCAVANMCCLVFMFVTHYDIYTKLCILIYNIFKTSEAIVDVLHGEEQKKWRLDIIGMSFGIRGIISLLTFIGVLYFSKNMLLTISIMTLSVYIFIWLYDLKKYYKIIGKVTTAKYKRVFNLLWKCLPITIYGILTSLVSTYPRIILENKLGEELLGIYSSVYSPTMIIQVAAMFIFNPLITLFAEYYHNKDSKNFYKLIFKVTLIIIFISIVGLIGVNIFGTFGLRILYGNDIIKYSYLLSGLVIVTILTAFTWFVSNILIASRKFILLIIGPIMSFGLTMILSGVLISKYAMDGVNYTLIISYVVQILFSMIFGYLLINRDFKKH